MFESTTNMTGELHRPADASVARHPAGRADPLADKGQSLESALPLKAQYINPFLAASTEVFQTMVRIPLSHGRPHVRNGVERQFAVTATIGISGTVTGTVVLSFPQQVAFAVAAALAGSPITSLNQDCVDALGELTNMIAGSAKSKLPGGNNSLSLPNVTLGNHRVLFPSGNPVIAILCDTPQGQFLIEVGFRQ